MEKINNKFDLEEFGFKLAGAFNHSDFLPTNVGISVYLEKDAYRKFILEVIPEYELTSNSGWLTSDEIGFTSMSGIHFIIKTL